MKKLIATALSALMALMAAAFPALAADYTLTDFPSPFVEDTSPNFTVVVGKDAKVMDVVSGLNVAARLGGETVTTGAAGVITGGESEEIALGDAVAASGNMESTLDDADLAGLLDTSISFDPGTGSEDYNVHEEVSLGTPTTKLKLQTSLTSDEDYESNVFMEIGRDDLQYFYKFDDSINITKASSNRPLEIKFLGKDLEITSASYNSITAQVGTEATLYVGDSVTVEGKTVTLENVGSGGTIVVDVDGETESISSDSSSTVNGIEVENKETFYTDTKSERMATIIAGEKASETYTDGDAYIGEDEDNPDWIWNLASLNSTDPTLGIENDFVADDLDDKPTGVGEAYSLPNDYVQLKLDSLTVKDEDYADYSIIYEDSIDLSDISSGLTSEQVFTISTTESEGITNVKGTTGVETDTLYLYYTQIGGEDFMNVTYVDTDDNKVKAGGAFNVTAGDTGRIAKINYDDSILDINVSSATPGDNVTVSVEGLSSGNEIKAVLGVSSNKFAMLGDTASTEEPSELLYGSTNIGSKDKDLRNKYGIIVKDPETNGANDQVKLSVPADQVEAKVIASGPGTKVTAGEAERSGQITSNIAKMDTEISDPATAGNLIMVGGPCANLLVSKLADENQTKACDEWSSGDGGMIQLVNDAFASGQTALIVAGWSAEDTKAAAAKLQSAGITETLSGTKVTV